MVVRVIDIETTGIDPASDAIIEIASVDLVRGGGIANARSTYVAPGQRIPAVSSAVHHLTDEDVRDADERDKSERKMPIETFERSG